MTTNKATTLPTMPNAEPRDYDHAYTIEQLEKIQRWRGEIRHDLKEKLWIYELNKELDEKCGYVVEEAVKVLINELKRIVATLEP